MARRSPRPPSDLEAQNAELRRQLRQMQDVQARLGALSEKFVLINRISQELNVLDIEAIGQIAVGKVPPLIGARFASMYLYDDEADELVLRSHNHPETIAERVKVKHHHNTVMGLALARKRIVHIADIEDYERRHQFRFARTFAEKYVTRSCISAPLLAGQFTVGILNFADKLDGTPFSELDDVPIVEQISAVLGMAIRNCTLFAEVNSQARTDPLTKLANYRAFQEALAQELRRCGRYLHPLTLMLLDIDDFKKVNDTHGHPACDRVLQQVAEVLTASIRREDYTARQGGDEFALILIETGPKTAEIVAGRLIRSIGQHAFAHDGRSIPVTVSIGVAGFRAGMTPNDLVQAADRALLEAKQQGKNRFVVAQ
jgi:diguanylate cyclase (GGDEF)-like protein